MYTTVMITPATQELIDTFSMMDNWEERYEVLIDMGKNLPKMPDVLKTDGSIVKGCVSNVWMIGSIKDGKLSFLADSDAHIVRGLIALLNTVYIGSTPDEVLKTDIKDIFSKIGFSDHISPSRRNGFFAMVGRIKSIAEGAMVNQE